jgi:hypothetical protein
MNTFGLYLCIIVGISLSLVVEEVAGVNLGGVMVPGYVALIFSDYRSILVIYLISLLVFATARLFIFRLFALTPREKLITLLTLSFCCTFFINGFFLKNVFITAISTISPALLSYNYIKQGVMPTLLTSLVSSAVVFLIVTIIV